MHRQPTSFTINNLLPNALLAIFILTGTGTGTASAELYKHVNPDGSVEFTDIPTSKNDEPLKLAPLSTFKSLPQPPMQAGNQTKPAAVQYTSAKITSPTNEATIRENAGNIVIKTTVSPSLQSGHKLVLFDNGVIKGESSNGSFTITNADRGSHVLSIQVQNKAGKVLISSKSVTVYLRRHSVLSP